MQNRNDSDLKIAIAQSLENLNRAGLHWLARGSSASVTQWMSEHGGKIEYSTKPGSEPTVATIPSAVESLNLAPTKVEAAQLIRAAPLAEEAAGSWNTPRLPASDRQPILDAQAQLVAACNKCSELVCSRSRTVYGVGNCNTEIVFIGEGPGFEEDRQGIPFVGPAGQLLDKIILAMKLQRSDVYIMNAVKCRPQNNRNPTDEEIANCQPFFQKQLETIQPKFIVCLGAIAARALLKTPLGIGKLRGKFYSYCGAKVAVTYHPAYLLRNPDAKKLTWDDMKMVMSAM